MGLNSIKIQGINISIISKQKVLEEVRKYLSKNKKQRTINKKNTQKSMVIFTPNPEIIIYGQKDKYFQKIVNSAQINIPDGSGVVWALKKICRIKISQISGVDLMLALCQKASRFAYTIGLIGGRGGLAVETRECLQKLFPKLSRPALAGDPATANLRGPAEAVAEAGKIELLGEPEIIIKEQRTKNKEQRTNFIILNKDGRYIDKEKYFWELINEINTRKIDILFVALGFPKQEYFIESVKRLAVSVKLERPLVMMGVGGAFDYISGRIPRAPRWMRERGLEWLYRLGKEPWRIKRHIIGAQFFLQVILERRE